MEREFIDLPILAEIPELKPHLHYSLKGGHKARGDFAKYLDRANRILPEWLELPKRSNPVFVMQVLEARAEFKRNRQQMRRELRDGKK